MSLLGQLSSSYGKKDTVGMVRDIDLVLGLGYDHPELDHIFRSTRDRIIQTLGQSPEKGFLIRNDFFDAKNPIIENEELSIENRAKLKGVDHINMEYQKLMKLRQMMTRDPKKTLDNLISSIDESLKNYPIPKNEIISISKSIEGIKNETDFYVQLDIISAQLGHVGIIAFLEGSIAVGKELPYIIHFAKQGQVRYEDKKQNSMEYWDYTNITNLAKTRQAIEKNPIEGKSFSLSGGSGNTFAQLAIMQKYVENGGKIQSISGTSMGAAMAILVARVGNDSEKLKELMDDIFRANADGSIPEKLQGNEGKMKQFFDTLIVKHGLTYETRFSELDIPVMVNAGRQYHGGEQEIVLCGDERIMDAVWASMNVPFFAYGLKEEPIKTKLTRGWKKGGTEIFKALLGNDNTGALRTTPVHGVNLIDYAANERGNPTHWLELLGIQQKNMIDIDAGYSSEKGGSSIVRRGFKRANTRDFLAKMRISGDGGTVIDVPLDSSEGYIFPQGTIERFFQIGQVEYEQSFQN